MRILRRLVTSVFGNLSWQPPGWIPATGRKMRGHPRATVLVALLLMAGSAAGWHQYQWYKKQPKPVKYTVTATAPGVTPLDKVLHPQELVIRFNGSVAPIDYVGKLIRTGVRMDPAADGLWRWRGDRELVFTPENDWPADTNYHIAIDKSAVAPQALLERYKLDVKTPPFTASFKKLEFYQDPRNPLIKQVVATLEFSHKIAHSEIENHLTLAMLGGSPVFNANGAPFGVNYGLHDRIAYITSAALTLPEKEDFMKVALDKKMTTPQGGAKLQDAIEQKVRIPDNYSFFKIESVESQIIRNKLGDPEQLLFVNTTAAAKPEDIAKSLEVFLLPKKAVKAEGEDAGGDEGTSQPDTETDNDSSDDSDSDTEEDGPSDPFQHSGIRSLEFT